MKRILMALGCAILASSTLPGQGQIQSATRTATGLGRTEPESDRDLNIRVYIELLRSDVKKAKVQVMGDVMQFSGEQAATFWPIYKQFESELAAVGDNQLALVKDFAAHHEKMTDTVADRLATSLMAIEQKRMDLKKKYYERFKSVLDATTAARFLQVENQLERLIDLQITSELPVIR